MFNVNILRVYPYAIRLEKCNNIENETVHSNSKNSIQTIDITENSINNFPNQIKIINHDKNPNSVIKRILTTQVVQTRWYLYVTNQTFEEQINKFLKEYGVLKQLYTFYFQNDEDQNLFKNFCRARVF